ncbi:MAG TPA: protease modulator HflC [Candidatus Acidoferrum sp.]|nr:protease modulator HflC [Candidatus Acidoferrum sp.]
MNRFSGAAILIVAIVGIIILLQSVFTVHQSERALVLRLGAPVRATDDPGLHFKIPFVENVVTLSKRVLKVEGSQQELLTTDQKRVVVDYFARYRILNPLLFYQSVRSEESLEQRLQPIIASQMRRVLGKVEMSRILTKERAALMHEITLAVDAEAKNFGEKHTVEVGIRNQKTGKVDMHEVGEEQQGFGIQVLDVRMKRVDLPTQNSEAIFKRMQSQRQQAAALIRAEGDREALTKRAEADKQKVVIVAEAQQKGQILQGEGDGKATAIYNDAYGRDPKFFDFYRSMQALTTSLGGDSTTYVGPATGDFFRYFGTGGQLPPTGGGNAGTGP